MCQALFQGPEIQHWVKCSQGAHSLVWEDRRELKALISDRKHMSLVSRWGWGRSRQVEGVVKERFSDKAAFEPRPKGITQKNHIETWPSVWYSAINMVL